MKSKYSQSKQDRQKKTLELKTIADENNIAIGQAQENWYKAANVLVDKYLKERIITPTEFAFYHVILRYTKGFQMDERPFSLRFIKSISGFDPKTSLQMIDKLEILGILAVKRGDRNNPTILKPLFKSNAPDEYSKGQDTVGDRKIPSLGNGEIPSRVIGKFHQYKDNNKENSIKEKEVEATPESPKDFEQIFTEEIQRFSLEVNNSKLRIGFGNSKLGELVDLCDGDISILKKKLSHYRERRKTNLFLAGNAFSLGVLLQAWDDLSAAGIPDPSEVEKVVKFQPKQVEAKPKYKRSTTDFQGDPIPPREEKDVTPEEREEIQNWFKSIGIKI